MQTAANILDAQIADNISVNIEVGYGTNAGTPITAGALATGGPNYVTCNSYAQLANALTAQATKNNCSSIVAALPATDPTQGAGYWELSTAQAKVLGIPDPNNTVSDGSVGFSNTVSWGFDASQGLGGAYDFVSTALHELTHALGRINLAASNTPSSVYPLDSSLNLYTYSSSGTLQLGSTAPAYFSMDGGKTNLNNFDMSAGGDPGDWATTLTDSFGPGPAGVAGPMTATDWLVMEALGFKINPTYILFGPTAVNTGAHDYLQLSTVNVPVGQTLSYSISGLSASQLDSGSLTGTVTVGADGTATIDLGISNNNPVTATTQVTVTLGSNLATYTLTVANATNNTITFTPLTTLVATTSANDTITGVSGNDVVSYSGASTDYTITSPAANTLQVMDSYQAGRDGTDTLIKVDRLKFTDTSVAFDLGTYQSAGETAEILGAGFGKSAVSNASYMGQGIKLFDDPNNNMSSVAALVVGLINAPSHSAFVQTVWNNVVGSPIDPTDLHNFTQMLDNGTYSEASLLVLAATVQANLDHIGLVGLAAHGIDYTPV
jgi:hypothetical protein